MAVSYQCYVDLESTDISSEQQAVSGKLWLANNILIIKLIKKIIVQTISNESQIRHCFLILQM